MRKNLHNLIPALITLILVILAFLAGWIQGQINVYKNQGAKENLEFKVYTSAICKENPESIECKDKVFVKCGDTEHLINITNATGQFGKGWSDFRGG